jgi:Kef-type K+ transport system membrane component KefB
VLALGGLFATYGWLLVVFIAVSAVALLVLPRLLRLAIRSFGHRVSEPEIKLLLVILFGLGGLATQAGSEAVLPAYVAGLVVAGVFLHDRVLMDRLRSIAFALLTPFFSLSAGTEISAPALIAGAGVIGLLLLVKLTAKLIGVWPVAAAFKLAVGAGAGTTLRSEYKKEKDPSRQRCVRPVTVRLASEAHDDPPNSHQPATHGCT